MNVIQTLKTESVWNLYQRKTFLVVDVSIDHAGNWQKMADQTS